MTEERYRALVIRLERQARDNPGTYKFRVALLAALGYLYILIILGIALGLLGGSGVLIFFMITHAHAGGLVNLARLLVPLGVFTLVILRALWIRFGEPDGLEVARDEAVPLFLAIDRIREILRVPRFDKVLFTDELNAAVIQVPRLGIFGWHRNILIIGMPLLMTLSPDQFRSVLAHEMGHISGAHGKFGGWIYRLQMTWNQLIFALEHEGHRGVVLFLPFLHWYAPYFSAFTFALRRANEYEADRAAADVVGARIAADALSVVEIIHGYFTQINGAEPMTPQQLLNNALLLRADVDDTHPSLGERLRALGQESRVPDPPAESAASKFLGHRTEFFCHALGMVASDT